MSLLLYDKESLMDALYRWGYYVLITVLLLRVIWLLIYRVFGVYLGSISINNGFSFNDVHWHTSKISISASSVRIRLWGNSRKLVISDLNVRLRPNNKKTSSSKENFVSGEPLSIYPKSKLTKYLIRAIIKLFPSTNADVKRFSFATNDGEFSIALIRFNLSKHKSIHEPGVYRFSLMNAIYQLSGEIPAADSKIPLMVGCCVVTASCSADATTGAISQLSSRIHCDDTELDVLSAIKSAIGPDKNPYGKEQNRSTANIFNSKKEKLERTTTSSLEQKLDKFSTIHKTFFGAFQDFSINIRNSSISGIPLLPPHDVQSFGEFLKDDESKISVSVSVSAISLTVSRITKKSAGFEVLFDNVVDKPVEINASISILAAHFVTKKYDENNRKVYYKKDEFFHIPNFSLATKTNMNDRFASGYGYKDTVSEMFCSGSSPIFDVTTDQFGLLTYNYVVLKKMMRLNKLKKKAGDYKIHSPKTSMVSSSESEDDTQVASSESSTPQYPVPKSLDGSGDFGVDNAPQSTPKSLQGSEFETTLLLEKEKKSQFDKIVSFINEFYPRIDLKFTVEQPRTMIRSYNKVTNATHILTMGYSMMVLRVANASNNRYGMTCDFLHPCISYSERYDKHHVEDFCGLSDFTIRCNMSKSFKLSASLKMHGAYLNLTKPDVLNGISSIFQEATRVANGNLKYGLINKHFDGELARELEINTVHRRQKSRNNTSSDRIFSNLPSWLVSASLKITDVNIKLGSTSPLLPPELISKLSENSARHSNIQNFFDTNSILNFTISDLKFSIRNSTALPSNLVSSSSSSSETLAQDLDNHIFWQLMVGSRNIKLCLIEDQKRLPAIVYVPDFSLKISSLISKSNKNLQIISEIGPLSGHLDRHSIFVIIGSIYLVNETIVTPIKALFEKLGKNMATLKVKEQKTGRLAIMEHLSYKIILPKASYVFSLSEDFKLCLQVYQSQIEGHEVSFTFSTDLIRLLVNYPNLKGYWNRLVCLDSLKFKVNDSEDIQNFVLDTTAIRIIQPHQFVTYKLFDNIAIFVKIVKHLVLSMKTAEKSIIVLPKESRPLRIPAIKVKAERISFDIEDDPFESELGMIYQLGRQEQMKRLEMIDLFNEKSKSMNMSDDKRTEMIEELQRSMMYSWIRKVNSYKSQVTQEIIRNKHYLFGKEIDIGQEENKNVTSYSRFAPLCHFVLSGVNLDLSSTKFSFRDLPQFIHELGQGVPMDTRYNTMIPSYVDLGVKEVRIHARDYPLPLLYLPEATDSRGNGNALIMKGHLIICEALKLAKENLREIEILLTKAAAGSQPNSFDKLIIEKSMASTKLFTDLDIQFGSKAPSRFVWGQSYQFAIQQIMANVDQFSKPPVDPSPKLGFWDKMRYILHGRCVVKATEGAIIEFAFKGGRDPYDLFEKSSGFVLSFRDQVRWDINSSDESLEFGKVKSKRVLWYIPNYLSAPLLCWCRESWKSTNFLEMNDLVISCFGYYLNQQVTEKKRIDPGDVNICEKKVVELSGGVDFTVGFLLQRKSAKDGSITTDGKLHWEIDLYNPTYTSDDHDSYVGFRSDRVHMAITLIAHTDSSYNTIHLTPGVFKQFFEWWSLFQGNMMLQVRRGKLFGDPKTSATKFSEHLFTNKFLFHIKDLFLGHVYRDERNNENNKLQFLGMRAKVSEFLVDLHQRKEERVDVHEDLSRHKKVMKMNFNKAEVALTHIDLRMMYAEFDKDIYEKVDTHEKASKKQNTQKCKYKVFDQDYQWFDDQDYIEAFAPSTGGERIRMESLPFMYSEKFAFIRQTNCPDKIDWGDEHTHGCMLGNTNVTSTGIEMCKKRLVQLDELGRNSQLPEEESMQLAKSMDSLQQMKADLDLRGRKDQNANVESSETDSEESFNNRFVLISMLLKWNEGVRNLFLKYIHFVQLRANARKYLSYEFITMLEGIIERNSGDGVSSLMTSASGVSLSEVDKLKSVLNDFSTSKDRLENFDKIIRNVRDDESFEESFKIQVVSPQIQLHSETVDNSVVLVTAPVLESKIITVTTRKDQLMGATKELITRYGVILHDASIMVVDKKIAKTQTTSWDVDSYGSKSAWPPFLGIEICKNHLLAQKGIVLAEKMSMMLTYDQIKATNPGVDQKEDSNEPSENSNDAFAPGLNCLRVDVPELAINCTSSQYFSLYVTVLSLLLYTEPKSAHLAESLSKLKFSIDFQDFTALHERLISLRTYLGAVTTLFNNYSFRHADEMDNEKLNEYLQLKDEKEEFSSEICLILQTLFSGDIFTDISASSKPSEDWRIAADKIILNILTDDRKPILELSVDHGRCKRVINEDGSNHNRIEIKKIEGRSLVKGSFYDKFLEPSYPPDDNDLITVDWSMMRPVGGIKIIENFDINSQPLNVKLDEKTGMELMNFIFHLENTQSVSESPVSKAANHMGPKTEEDEDSSISDSNNDGNSKSVHFQDDHKVPNQVKKQRSLSLLSDSENLTEYKEDVNEMLRRSKNYLTVVSMVCHSFELTISLKMKHGFKRWLNVEQFTLKLPEWSVEKKVTSFLGVTDVFKSIVIKTILGHSGLLIANKLRTRSSNARHRLASRGVKSYQKRKSIRKRK